jgi:pimeloyl-ACP methyl ester carboxylesterase
MIGRWLPRPPTPWFSRRALIDWAIVAPLLARKHRVVAVDVRGHGKSGDGPWSWSEAASDVAAVAAHSGMSSPAVMGHSLGGMIATMLGHDHPDSAGIINFDGHGNPKPTSSPGSNHLPRTWGGGD